MIDLVVIVIASSARVAIELLRGNVLAQSDLGRMFIPNYSWWWPKPRWFGGWNPWIYGGYPANADPLIGQLHPFGVLYAIFPPLTAVALDAALTPSMAGFGMLAYLRTVGTGRTASLVGALSFAIGGFMTGHAPHPPLQRAALAVPWALAAIEAFDGAALAAALAAATGA